MTSAASYQPSREEIEAWAHELEALHARIASRFQRSEPRRRALAYLQGLLSSADRKNGWQLAEEAGERTPDGMQRLVNASRWDADGVRDDLLAYVREHLADPAAILVVDETGFLKKGTKSAGVKRQYTGTAGKRENCQIGVFVAYSSWIPAPTQVLVDRELYLPVEWASDCARREEAGVPEDVAFATKPELAQRMLARLRADGLLAAWVTGDTVYGGSPTFRTWLEAQRQPYVLAIAASDGVDLPYGEATMHVLPEEIAQYALDPPDWRRLSAGDGAKGPRLYEWALVPLAAPSAVGFEQALLTRRPVGASDDPKQLAYYLTFAPVGTLFETLVMVAGRRWTVEESLAAAKGEVGLDHYEVRHYHSWYRHITLAMLALAYLAVVRSRLPGAVLKGGALLAELATHGELIPLTVPEVRRLVYRLVVRILAPPEAVLHWSCWRRRHQAHAIQAHYRRRLAQKVLL
jgi:SRSO17 transposase